MRVFALPYRIHFDDTMAYGSHHYLTNFKFQCAARERLYFSEDDDGGKPWQADRADIVLLTVEGYSRNMAPVQLADDVIVFMTFGEVTRSSVLSFYRTVRSDGEPVAFGYQRIVTASASTQGLVPVPASITRFQGRIDETTPDRELIEALHRGAGPSKKLIPDALRQLARKLSAEPDLSRVPQFLSVQEASVSSQPRLQPVVVAQPVPERKKEVVLLFPGQGSFDGDALRGLFLGFPMVRDAFIAADVAARAHFGTPFLPLVASSAPEKREAVLAACPELDQLGIYLTNVLTADLLRREGLTPAGLVGHSFGELAAWTVAGALSIERGVHAVCARVKALELAQAGRMLAVSAARERVEALIADSGLLGLEISVINHAEQTVVSGELHTLEAFRDRLATRAISATVLKGRYPFHSSRLAPAVGPFAVALRGGACGAVGIPVYSPIDLRWHREPEELSRVLPMHFVESLDFRAALANLYAEGYRSFVECGAGSTLAKLVERNLAARGDVRVASCIRAGEALAESKRRMLATLAEWGALASVPAAAAQPSVSADKPAETTATQTAAAAGPAPMGTSPTLPQASTSAGARERRAPTATAPIALVGAGAVLPGAAGEEGIWRLLRDGTSGIVDFAELDPGLRGDFMVDGGAPDKTYSLLGGYVADLGPFEKRTALRPEELDGLAKPEKMLACALAELKAQTKPIEGERTLCLLGATADGSIERDEEVFLRSVADVLTQIELDPARRQSARAQLERMFRRGPAPRLDQHAALAEVVRRHFGGSIRTILIDAACASSLYAVGVAMSLLELGVYDAVIAGGVYEPGPANACLFSQFKGLSATGTRPFDARADGVVFGEGAAVVLLKRLPDAQRDGDRIRAVIRAVGVSSDGRSPSVNVPRAQGQALAMRRAYQHSGVDPASIQFVEAHATATRVGDATEFQGLLEVFGKRNPGQAKIRLESVKNQIGHTGWVAGVASMIKVMRCFEERCYPAQHGFRDPSPKLALEGSPFVIPQRAEAWPENDADAPRRAAVDGFGFGGTNAHVVMEEYRERDWQGARFARPISQRVAVVGLGALYPDAEGMPSAVAPSSHSVRAFAAARLPLPKKVVILPDVRESMDATQMAALLACERALAGLPMDVLRDDIGVVIGLSGKTALSASAGERIFLDRLLRLTRAGGLDGDVVDAVVTQLRARTRASGPYTLPGAMPNVTAGRVANLLDVHGPNFVLDTGASSLADSLKIGPQLLAAGCKVVLVGGLNAFSGPLAELVQGTGTRPIGEGVLMLALALEPTVRELRLPVLAWLDTVAESSVAPVEVGHAALDLRGAEGAIELQQAIENARERSTTLRWPETGRLLRVVPPSRALASRPSVPPPATREIAVPALLRAVEPSQERSVAATTAALGSTDTSAHEPKHRSARPAKAGPGFVTGTPILLATPVLAKRARKGRGSASLSGQRALVLLAEEPSALGGLPENFQALAPMGCAVSGVLAVDTTSEAAMAERLGELSEPALLLSVIRCADDGAQRLLEHGHDLLRAPLALLFGAFKHYYAAIEAGRISVGVLVLSAVDSERNLRVESAVMSGFAKAQVRELPNANIRIVNTDEAQLGRALAQLGAELSEPARAGKPEEVWYVAGERHVMSLREIAQPSAPPLAELDQQSVVLATGGARGITAVLVEGLLERAGCTIYLVGRSDPARAPLHVLAMSDTDFDAYEKSFYAQAMKQRPAPKMAALKREYETWRSVREVASTLRTLAARRGKVVYRCADVQNEEQLAAVVRELRVAHGRLDLVVHGAGVQVSKRLPSKSLETFEWIIDTKLSGLAALKRAVSRELPEARPHMHLMTSAFSYIGNDGQPDYGAANEAMNRLASALDGPRQRFSSLAWLGWDGIGMTAGSEFAALGERRGLRGVRPEEGQAIFQRVLSQPQAAVNVTVAQGELDYFSLDFEPAQGHAEPSLQTVPMQLSLAAHPYLAQHLVRGRPVAPGTMELELVARAARKLYPQLQVLGFDAVEFTRFVGLSEGVASELWVTLEQRSAEGRERRLHAEVRGRFKHSSGRVLDPNLLHASMEIRLGAAFSPLPAEPATRETSVLVRDPYACGVEVEHRGPFAHLGELALGKHSKNALFRSAAALPTPAGERWELPMLLLDACLTLGMICRAADGSYPVCAAHGVGRIRFARALIDAALPGLGPVVIHGTVPSGSEQKLLSAWVQARGSSDQVLVDVRGMRGSPMGKTARALVEDRAGASAAFSAE